MQTIAFGFLDGFGDASNKASPHLNAVTTLRAWPTALSELLVLDRMLCGAKNLPNDGEIYPCRDWNRGGPSHNHFL